MWNEVSAIALGQDIGRVCCHGLPFFVLNWEALILTDNQQSYCLLWEDLFFYEENSLSEVKGVKFTVTTL
jgi:hypothetical protein